MSQNWPTKDHDLRIAAKVIEEYAEHASSPTLGLFELVLNAEKKRMAFRVANWVMTLAHHFSNQYGTEQGTFVLRKVISNCFVSGQTLH